jgi:excisionase family DNA binding protein
MDQSMTEQLMTVRETAAALRVSSSSVWRLIRAGSLPVVRLGGSRGRPVRVSSSALADVLQSWARTPVEEKTA